MRVFTTSGSPSEAITSSASLKKPLQLTLSHEDSPLNKNSQLAQGQQEICWFHETAFSRHPTIAISKERQQFGQ
jgi:hypothetical protein